MVTLSQIGFAQNPFGSGQFGIGDWAEEVTWKIIPEFYRSSDQLNPEGVFPGALREFINSIKPLFQELRIKLLLFPGLWDVEVCSFPQLGQLGYNVGIEVSSVQNLKLKDFVTAPFTIGETLTSDKGETATLYSVTGTEFSIINLSSGGFAVGDVITGSNSGSTVTILGIAGDAEPYVLTVSTFVLGEQIKNLSNDARGTIQFTTEDSINITDVTSYGFDTNHTIKGLTSGASAVVVSVTSDGKTDNVVRSNILNASQLWINKGTVKGYQIVGAFEGLNVIITPLWSDSCEADPNGELLTELGPETGSYLAYYDKTSADIVKMDKLHTDPYAAWPLEVDSVVPFPGFPEGRCRSYSLRLYFYDPDDQDIENFDAVSGRIIENLENFRPIHVKLNEIRFDGPNGASQDWTLNTISAENAAAYSWTTSVIGSLSGASQDWLIPSLTV